MNSYTLSPNIENPSTHPVQNTLQEDNARSGSIPVSLQRQQGHLQSSLFYSILVSTSLSRRLSLHHGDSTESSTEPRSECGPFIKPCLTSINPSHQKICDMSLLPSLPFYFTSMLSINISKLSCASVI